MQELTFIKDAISKVPDEVVNSVVGVPYSRFDATTTCLPCLIFHFVEVTNKSQKRSSQIKVRVNLEDVVNDSNALSNQIDIYVQRIKQRSSHLKYQYGNNRLYFISDNKAWKTVVYTDSQSEGRQVIEQIAFIAGYEFSESLISFTTSTGRKPLYTRQRAWKGISTNRVNYKTSFPMKIRKVVCYIKNLDQLVQVWKE